MLLDAAIDRPKKLVKRASAPAQLDPPPRLPQGAYLRWACSRQPRRRRTRAHVQLSERAEAHLRVAHEQLEARVQERAAGLARANQELRRSTCELGQFAYVSSHGLQEPLRMTGNYTQLLGRRY